MAFTATINTIKFQSEGIRVDVTYLDSATGFTATRSFSYPLDGSATQVSVANEIKAVGAMLKANLVIANAILANVGTVLTIT